MGLAVSRNQLVAWLCAGTVLLGGLAGCSKGTDEPGGAGATDAAGVAGEGDGAGGADGADGAGGADGEDGAGGEEAAFCAAYRLFEGPGESPGAEDDATSATVTKFRELAAALPSELESQGQTLLAAADALEKIQAGSAEAAQQLDTLALQDAGNAIKDRADQLCG
jgi:hypothetical protein